MGSLLCEAYSVVGALLRHAIRIIKVSKMHVVVLIKERVSCYCQVSLCLSLASRVVAVGFGARSTKSRLLQNLWSKVCAAPCVQ